MENKNKIFHFLTWEPVEKNLTPLVFPIFSGTPRKFLEENKVFLKASICGVLMVESLLGVDPTQSYGEITKKTIRDFIDFAIGLYQRWRT